MNARSRPTDQTDPQTIVLQSTRADSSERQGACLVVIRGPRLGGRIDLGDAAVVIGRAVDADFQIDSRSVSRSHCRISADDQGFWLEDLRSTNATFVNDEPVERHLLTDGDQIRIGKTVLKFLGPGNLEAAYLADLQESVVRDDLTGLYNRRHFTGLLGDEISRCRHSSAPKLVLAIIDIDHFKPINDEIGHLAGDSVLRELSARLVERIRASDTLARIGGEEFALVMPDTEPPAAADICERLRACVEADAFSLEDERSLAVTISIGVTAWDEGMTSASDLLRRADQRLYSAKSNGRNRVVSDA